MNDNNFIKELNKKIKRYGVSQARLAVAIGISREYLNRIINGKFEPSEELKEKILYQIERFNPKEPLFILIDYFRVRFPTTDVLTIIRDVLRLKPEYMLQCEYGKYGYENKYIIGNVEIMYSQNPQLGVLLELKGKGCRQMESYLLAQERSWYDFIMDCIIAEGIMKRFDIAINDRVGILDVKELIRKYKNGECISYFRKQKNYDGTLKNGDDFPECTGSTLYLGSTSSEMYMCIYEKDKEQYVKNGIDVETAEVKNRFEIRLKNERAYLAVQNLLLNYDIEETAFSIINHYVRFVDRDDEESKNSWKPNSDWEWFIGENRERIKLTTQPESFTLEHALSWLQRQVAPTLKMVQELDKQNNTTILQDIIEHAKLTSRHKHLLELDRTSIEDRIDTVVPRE